MPPADRKPELLTAWRNIRPDIFAFNDHGRDAWVAAQAQRIPAGARILDVGAGPCRYRPLFSHCHYESQDFAQYKGSDRGPFTDLSQWSYGKIDYISDATAIPVSPATFDVVLCTEVLEHVPDPVGVVNELGRILKPGGRLLLTAPLGSGLHQEPYHFYGGYTPYWYERFLPQAGFENIEVVANGGFFKHYAQEGRRFSALLDPRRAKTGWPVVPLFWLVTLPWFRVVMPVLCHYLDRLDSHRGFTVGYHVSATRRTAAEGTR
jgi:SAM-dependent methyltransferase